MNNHITYEVNIEKTADLTDEALALLWHAIQRNTEPLETSSPSAFADEISREIIRRWLAVSAPRTPGFESGQAWRASSLE